MSALKFASQPVSQPLLQLSKASLPEAWSHAEQVLAQNPEASEFETASSYAAGIAAELRQIVTRMGRIEDLAELVSGLKKIIREQEELLQQTRRKPR